MEYTPAQVEALILQYGSKRKTAEMLGIPEATLRAKLSDGRPIRVSQLPDPRLSVLENENAELRQRLQALEAKASKPRIIPGKEGRVTKIVAIGDTHDQPGMSKERFKWIARHCGEVMPDRVVHIGDLADFGSVSGHEQPGTVAHAERPRFMDDLESLEEALALFHNEIRNCDFAMELTCGNHEDRITRFENKTPETKGALYSQFEEMVSRYRWRCHDYGVPIFIDGCCFIHTPMNQMGKPYGGKTSENQIANDATYSLVYGHTHKAVFKKAPKIGINNSIEVLNLGSAMPWNFVAPYAGTATSGWSYGICELKIRAGHIVSHNFIDMLELEELYS